jgi:hypothetical protein
MRCEEVVDLITLDMLRAHTKQWFWNKQQDGYIGQGIRPPVQLYDSITLFLFFLPFPFRLIIIVTLLLAIIIAIAIAITICVWLHSQKSQSECVSAAQRDLRCP